MVTTNPFTTANYVEAVDALNKTIKEQADEIERLREALDDIVTRLVTAFPAMEEFPPIKNARAALKEGE